MKLSELPFDNVTVGLRVRSAKGTPGTVTAVYKDPFYKDWDTDGWFVDMEWDNGNNSKGFRHYDMFNVNIII